MCGLAFLSFGAGCLKGEEEVHEREVGFFVLLFFAGR